MFDHISFMVVLIHLAFSMDIPVAGKLLQKASIEPRPCYVTFNVNSRSECTLRCAGHTGCAGMNFSQGLCQLMDNNDNAIKADCNGTIVYYGNYKYINYIQCCVIINTMFAWQLGQGKNKK